MGGIERVVSGKAAGQQRREHALVLSDPPAAYRRRVGVGGKALGDSARLAPANAIRVADVLVRVEPAPALRVEGPQMIEEATDRDHAGVLSRLDLRPRPVHRPDAGPVGGSGMALVEAGTEGVVLEVVAELGVPR